MEDDTVLTTRAVNELYTPEQVAQALARNEGWIGLTAKELGCTPETVTRYCRTYPEVQKVRDLATEVQGDNAEKTLQELIRDKNVAAVIFYLKTRQKHRGYTEKTTLEVVPHPLQQRLTELCAAQGIDVTELLEHMVAELSQRGDVVEGHVADH